MTTSLHQTRLSQFINDVTIYPVSCEALSNNRGDIAWLDEVLSGGARIVQLRDKFSDDLTLFTKAQIFRKKTRDAGALFIVNNRLDIALASDADGIHLGNSDLPVNEARKLAPDLIIGVSANTEEQALSAKERGASYFNIGPLFQTDTKEGLTNFLGIAGLETFSKLSPLPHTVMGGIKLNHVDEITQLGTKRIAVVTALTQAEDICAETKKWIQAITNNLGTGDTI